MCLRHFSCGAIALSLAGIAGCKFDQTLPEEAQITCQSSSDCPEGYLCNAGLCANAIVPPPTLGPPEITPKIGRAGTDFTIVLKVSKALAALPEITLQHDPKDLNPPLAPVCASSGALTYRCTYTATGHENGGRSEQVRLGLPALTVPFDVRLRDDAHNETTLKGAGALQLDFVEPGLAVATVAYFPDASNPLPIVNQAKEGTRIQVTVIPDEPIRTDASSIPTLSATSGGTAIDFQLVRIRLEGGSVPDLTSTRANFEAVVPAASDGDYVPTLTWTDLAGNVRTLSFAAPAIRVKTSSPVLVVNQSLVTFLRSPWGNGAVEDLKDDRGVVQFQIPEGPYFALAPGDTALNPDGTLAPSATLAAGAFAMDPALDSKSVLAALRIWADNEQGSLLAVVSPNLDAAGKIVSWPRAPVHIDVPRIWATMLDDAGNESTPEPIVNITWVATGNPPTFGVSPHVIDASTYLRETLVPDGDTAVATLAGLEAIDGMTVSATGGPTFRLVSPGATPPERSAHAMAYDAARGRTVLFGGRNRPGQPLGDTWEWDGAAWADRTPTAAPTPSPRGGHAMSYDAARNRVILYGGRDASGVRSDTWEWDGSGWTQIPGAGAPGGREGHSIAYDAARRRVVLFGGAGTDATTWEWDGSEWASRALSSSPTGRSNFAMAFDVGRSRIVLFGGSPSGGPPGSDLWEYDGLTWRQPTRGGTAPPPREGHTLVYVPARGTVVLFGGSSVDRSTYEWNGASWVPGAVLAPAGRSRHGAVHDAVAARMVVFGGLQDAGGVISPTQTTWDWDGSAWLDRTPSLSSPTSPPGLRAAAMAFDEARRRVVVAGGVTQSGSFPTDVWEWDGGRWTRVVPPTPPPGTPPFGRVLHSMAYDADAQRVLRFGGADLGGAAWADLWEWTGTGWAQRIGGGTAPTPRCSAGAGYDSGRKVLVVFGGTSGCGATPLGDTFELAGTNPGPWTWVPKASHPLLAASSPSLLSDGAGVLAFIGAGVPAASVPELWRWDGTAWVNLTPTTGMPGARGRQTMVWDAARKRAILFGGRSVQGDLADLWEWTGDVFIERLPAPNGRWPRPRSEHAMAYDTIRKRAVLFGGFSAGAVLGDLWEWDADGTPDGLEQKRKPMVQLAVSYGGAGFTDAAVTALHVRARAGGRFGVAGTGALLMGWRSGGPGAGPGQWVPLAANTEGTSLPPQPAVLVDWRAAPADIPSFFMTRDRQLTFQLRPAGASAPAEPESEVAADYLEVRVRYAAP